MTDSFLNAFDAIIIIFIVVGIVMFLLGRGDQFMNMFRGSKAAPSPYDPEKEKSATFLLLIALLVCELVLVFLSKVWTGAAIIAVVAAIISIVIYILYLKKYAEKK